MYALSKCVCFWKNITEQMDLMMINRFGYASNFDEVKKIMNSVHGI